MDWFKEIRKKCGFTQSQLALSLGISQPTIAAIENRTRRPGRKLAKELANALNFDWTRFYEESQ